MNEFIEIISTTLTEDIPQPFFRETDNVKVPKNNLARVSVRVYEISQIVPQSFFPPGLLWSINIYEAAYFP